MATGTSISFPFVPTTNDQSIVYLYKLFGSMNGVLKPNSTDVPDSTASITLLGTMFQTFNSIVLVIGAFIVVYVTIVGVMLTAHEGEFMGKKWNNPWIPIRTVLGIASLVPTGSGYSGLQILMMWVIVQGVGAADTMWNTVLGYVSVMGSPYAQVSLPTGNVKGAVQNLFQGLVCAKAASKTYPAVGSGGKSYYCTQFPTDYLCQNKDTLFKPNFDNNTNREYIRTSFSRTDDGTTTTVRQQGYNFGIMNRSCGVLYFCDSSTVGACSTSNSLDCLSCKASRTALQAMIPTLGDIADKFVELDYQYRKYWQDTYSKQFDTWGNVKVYDNSVPRPAWIQDYCTGADKLTTCYAKAGDDGTGTLPNPSNLDNTPSNDLVDTVYWPYGMKKLIGDSSFITTSVSLYSGELSQAMSAYVKSVASDTTTDSEGKTTYNTSLGSGLDEARDKGWIFAGGYYYALTGMNNKNMKSNMPEVKFVLSDASRPSAATGLMYPFRNDYSAAKRLMYLAAGGDPGGDQASSDVTSPTSDASADMGDTYKSMLSDEGQTNPLVGIAATGTVLMWTVQILYVVFFAVLLTLGITGKINILVLGTGLTANPLEGATMMIYVFVVPLLFMFMGIMTTLGATMSIYIPLIPFIIFSFGAIGWLMSTIEAMVAGPLVALGILSPSGHHEIMGKAEPAIMLLFNIFLRPTLMIFGLIAAMLLASVAAEMINKGFGIAFIGIANIGGGAAGGPLALVFILCAYVSLIVATMNKCFAAIHIIPEKVMRWISGQPGESYGESDATGAVKGGVEGGASGAKGYGGAATGKMGDAEAKGSKIKKDEAKLGGGDKPPPLPPRDPPTST